jgi:hypothetical protein
MKSLKPILLASVFLVGSSNVLAAGISRAIFATTGMRISSSLSASSGHAPSSDPALSLDSLSSAPSTGHVDVTSYGAKCDWNGSTGTDDTNAIQKAIDSLESRNTFGALFLPVGSLCRITAPLLLNSGFVSIFGQGPGSGFVADYSAWNGKDYTALKLSTTIQHILPGETFADFSIIGNHNSGIVSTGFLIDDPLDGNPKATYVVGLNVHNVVVKQFDTAFSISDTINSLFSFLQAYYVRQGFRILGRNVNDNFHDLVNFSPSNNSSSSKDPLVGFVIDSKKYAAGVFGPEGINLDHSIFLSADTDLMVGQVLHMNVDHNIFDLAGGNAVVLSNPNEIKFDRNYVGINHASTSAIYVAAGTNIDGSSISNNTIMGAGLAGQTGIFLAPGGIHRGLHIDSNRLHGVSVPIELDTVPTFSTIQNNYGTSNASAKGFIRMGGSGSCGRGTVIRGNNDIAAIPMIVTTCRGFNATDNHSSAAGAASGSSDESSSGVNLSTMATMHFIGTLTTTAATKDSLRSPGVLAGAKCAITPQNAAAAELQGVYVPPVASAGLVEVYHPNRAGGAFSVFCQ